MQPFFIFKNINSKEMGVVVNKQPLIVKAEKNVGKIEIPGRNGFLVQDYGTYKSIVKSVECTALEGASIEALCAWLDGTGEVTFGNEPDKFYKATIINQIAFQNPLLFNRRFIVLFNCQPFKYMKSANITMTIPGTVTNPGTVSSNPIIKIYGNGFITVNINDSTINLTGINNYVTIDSELQDCYKDTQLMNQFMNGEFPTLNQGSNNISWTGSVTKIEITPNWRWL